MATGARRGVVVCELGWTRKDQDKTTYKSLAGTARLELYYNGVLGRKRRGSWSLHRALKPENAAQAQ
jgi:hypothetical protein